MKDVSCGKKSEHKGYNWNLNMKFDLKFDIKFLIIKPVATKLKLVEKLSQNVYCNFHTTSQRQHIFLIYRFNIHNYRDYNHNRH